MFAKSNNFSATLWRTGTTIKVCPVASLSCTQYPSYIPWFANHFIFSILVKNNGCCGVCIHCNKKIDLPIKFVFIVCQVEDYRNILKLSCRSLALQNKKRSGTSLPASLSAWFLKENILLYTINWLNFIVWLSLLREIFGSMCIVIVS